MSYKIIHVFLLQANSNNKTKHKLNKAILLNKNPNLTLYLLVEMINSMIVILKNASNVITNVNNVPNPNIIVPNVEMVKY